MAKPDAQITVTLDTEQLIKSMEAIAASFEEIARAANASLVRLRAARGPVGANQNGEGE